MKLIFTRSNMPLSIFIRWGLKEPVSHFAIVFDDNLMFQSNLLGTGIDYFPIFKQHCTVVYEIDIPLSKEIEDRIYDKIMPNFMDRMYDFKGFLYFAWRGILQRFFKIPLPKKNAWRTPETFICTGLVQCLELDFMPFWLNKAIKEIPDSEMISPYQLYLLLKP